MGSKGDPSKWLNDYEDVNPFPKGGCVSGWYKLLNFIEMNGYPGELEGHQYTHREAIQEIKQVNSGGHVIIHTIHGTRGNSGSPIFGGVDHYGVWKYPIGLHTGSYNGLWVAT